MYEMYAKERPWAYLTPIEAAGKVMEGKTLDVKGLRHLLHIARTADHDELDCFILGT